MPEKIAPNSDLVGLVEELSDDQRLELVKVLQISKSETTFSGPLPDPDSFRKYNEVVDNAAHRILDMAEKEQQIRADGQEGMLFNERRRINGATLIGLSIVAVAGAWQGNISIAVPLGLGGTIASLITNIWLKRQQRRRA